MLLHRVETKSGNWLLFHIWNTQRLSSRSLPRSGLPTYSAGTLGMKSPKASCSSVRLISLLNSVQQGLHASTLFVSPVEECDFLLLKIFWLLWEGRYFLIFYMTTGNRSLFIEFIIHTLPSNQLRSFWKFLGFLIVTLWTYLSFLV